MSGVRSMTVIGAGNIGSALPPHIARLPSLRRVLVVDGDFYEKKNIPFQTILPADVGRAKAIVQAERLRRFNPSLEVEAIVGRVENVPLGRLRSDVLLACVDSKSSRAVVNQRAWRLGRVWLDAGVNAFDGYLARLTVFVPGNDEPCIECGWSDRDYADLKTVRRCLGGGTRSRATNAPASLGGLAAAIQALECRKLFHGGRAALAGGREIMIDAMSHALQVTSLRRNADCRFDHLVWHIQRLRRGPARLTLSDLLDLAPHRSRRRSAVWAQVEGRPFVRRLVCPRCGSSRGSLHLEGRRRPARCSSCGSELAAVGFDVVDRLALDSVERRFLRRPVRRLGFLPADVVTVGNSRGQVAHYEIGCDRVFSSSAFG